MSLPGAPLSPQQCPAQTRDARRRAARRLARAGGPHPQPPGGRRRGVLGEPQRARGAQPAAGAGAATGRGRRAAVAAARDRAAAGRAAAAAAGVARRGRGRGAAEPAAAGAGAPAGARGATLRGRRALLALMRTAARRGGGWSGAEEDIRRRPRGRFAMDASEPVVRVLVCGMCTLKALSARGLQDAERWGAGKGPGEEWRGGAPPAGRGAGGPGRTGEWSAARRGGAAPHGPGRGQQPWDAPVGPPPGFPAKARSAPCSSAVWPSPQLPWHSRAPGHSCTGCAVPAAQSCHRPQCSILHRPFLCKSRERARHALSPK